MTHRCREIVGVFAVLATIVFASPAMVFSDEYTAAALIQIRKAPEVFVSTSGGANDFEVAKRTQAQLVKSYLVLLSALRDVADLPSIREQKAKIAWLRRRIKVDFPGDCELMRISITGPEPADELLELVESVVSAYMDNVVHKGRIDRQRMLDDLRAARRKVQGELSVETENFVRQSAALKANGSHAAEIKSHLVLHQMKLIQERRAQIRAKLDDVQLRAQLAEAAPKSSSQRSAIDIENKFWLKKLDRLGTEIDELTETGLQLNRRDAELEMLHAEIEQLRQVASNMDKKIRQWEMERLAPPRITIIEPPHTMMLGPAKTYDKKH